MPLITAGVLFMKYNVPFKAADILIPKKDHEKWAVIACDQFTSEPEYWKETEKIAKGCPSALNIILPEVYLEDGDTEKRIKNINNTMSEYLNDGVFEEYKDAMILVKRALPDGRVRTGIVGALSLDDYDYMPDSKPMIRATEGTVLSRIPPRVKIRKDAPLELPHIMVLIDDLENSVIGCTDKQELKKLYDFELMQGGGHLAGYLIPKPIQEKIISALSGLCENSKDKENPLLFAVGDGNHSLATAKACSENISSALAKHALVEIVNIHDPALDFEPIYRVLFNIDQDKLKKALTEHFKNCSENKVECIFNSSSFEFYADGLTSKALQDFIDMYIEQNEGASVDYIHGAESVKKLCQKENTAGFIFGGMSKKELFPYVIENGPLPRKTFSMGEAEDKRYYMEARKIK